MDAGCFPSLSSGKEFWFSKAVVVGFRGTNSRLASLAITGKGRQVMRHSTALCFFGENYGIRMAQSFRCGEYAIDASKCQQYIFIISSTKRGRSWESPLGVSFIPSTAFSPWVAETRRIGTWVSSKVPRPWKISNGDFLRDRGRGHLLIVNELVLDCIYEAKSHLHPRRFHHIPNHLVHQTLFLLHF